MLGLCPMPTNSPHSVARKSAATACSTRGPVMKSLPSTSTIRAFDSRRISEFDSAQSALTLEERTLSRCQAY